MLFDLQSVSVRTARFVNRRAVYQIGLFLCPKETSMTNNEDDLSMLSVDFDEFVEGTSNSKFKIEEGSYDGAKVVGYTIVKVNFEGKERKLIQLLWQFVDDNNVTHTIRGNGWSISSSENSKFRKEVSNWFGSTDWAHICDLLVKGNILVKDGDNKAHFDLEKFIGKRGKLLIQEKTSQSGNKYAVIASISPLKKKDITFEQDAVPEFMVEGKDIIKFKLADGIEIRRSADKNEKSQSNGNNATEAFVPDSANAEEDDVDLPF